MDIEIFINFEISMKLYIIIINRFYTILMFLLMAKFSKGMILVDILSGRILF